MTANIKLQLRRLIRQLAGSDPVVVQMALLELESLENIGLLKLQTVPSVSGPPRRYYKTTALGRSVLKRLMQTWDQAKNMADFVFKGYYR